jgi:hypothetical protein
MQMTEKLTELNHLSLPKLLLAVAIGVIFGAILLSTARAGYYILNDIRAEMSPMMFIVFSPVVAVILLAVAFVIELCLSLLWWRPHLFLQAVMLGGSYTLVLLGLITPWLLLLMLAINPITLRLWFIRKL